MGDIHCILYARLTSDFHKGSLILRMLDYKKNISNGHHCNPGRPAIASWMWPILSETCVNGDLSLTKPYSRFPVLFTLSPLPPFSEIEFCIIHCPFLICLSSCLLHVWSWMFNRFLKINISNKIYYVLL